jgi:hypothetical protein
MDDVKGTYAWNKPRIFSDAERQVATAANGTMTPKIAAAWLASGVPWTAGHATCLLHLKRPPALNCSKLEAGEFFKIIDAVAPGISETFDDPTRCLPAEVWVGFWQRSQMEIPAYLTQDTPTNSDDDHLLRWIAVLVHVLRHKLGDNTQQVARDEITAWVESVGWTGVGYSESSFNNMIGSANKALDKQLKRKGFEVPTH